MKNNRIIFKPLNQNNFGLKKDCTLTSITAIINYLTRSTIDVNTIYSEVEKIANKYFYNGFIWGTIPFFIKKIFDESYKNITGISIKTKSKYLKNIGFNFNTIKNQIDAGNPVILSLKNDGKNYYINHSVIIIGYENKDTLIIYNNWDSLCWRLDYNKISIWSCINYYDNFNY